MKKIVYFLISIGLNFLAVSQTFQWAGKIGGGNNSIITKIIDTDLSGNVYSAGTFNEVLDFDPGVGTYTMAPVFGTGNTVFIVKLDINGNFLWAKSFGRASCYGIEVSDCGDILLTGSFGGTVDFDLGSGIFNLTPTANTSVPYILKLDASGNFVFAKHFNTLGNISEGYEVRIDALGNIYSTGPFYNTIDCDPSAGTATLTSAGYTDTYISKLDPMGSYIWAKRIGGSIGHDIPESMDVDDAGNVYLLSGLSGDADLDPGINTYSVPVGTGITLIKLDPSGNFLWANRTGAVMRDVKADVAGDIVLTGGFGGTVDFDPSSSVNNVTAIGYRDICVLKLSSLGVFNWVKTMGGATAIGEGFAITTDGTNNIFITGGFSDAAIDFDSGLGVYNLSSSGGDDVFIEKLDISGNYVWAQALGAASFYDCGKDISVDGYGSVLVTGAFSDLVDFDAGTGIFNLSTPVNQFEIFLLKLEPPILPVMSPILGPSPICGGSIATYSIATVLGATNYSWTIPSGFIINSGQTTNSITVTIGSTSGTIMVTPSNSCITMPTSTMAVVVNNTPTITVTSVTLSCGSSATLSASGATTYTWSTGENSSNIVVTPTSNTTYTVLTGSGTCTSIATQSITVTSIATPTITASSTTVSCGSSATLTAIGATTYTWSNGETTSSIVVTPTASTTTYTVLSGSGTCTSSATQTITVSSIITPTIIASSTTVSCGSSATLTAIGATTYTWSTGESTSSIVVTPTASITTYTVLSGSGTCTSSATQTIIVSSIITPTILASSTTVSCGSSTTLTATGATTYTWSTGESTSSIVVTPTASITTYTVLSGSGTCTSSATQTIIVSSIITPTITASSTTVSCGSSATLTATGATTYTWSTGETASSIVVTPTASTTTYTVLSGSGTCTSSTNQIITEVNSLQTLTISPDVIITLGSQTPLTIQGNGSNHLWSPSLGLSCTTCTNPIASPLVTTNYCVISSIGTCTTQACVLVTVEFNCDGNKSYDAPNAFSPNGDGVNDEYCLQGWKGCVSNFNIVIYNRWGNKVFESSDESFCWDGKYQGKLLDAGVFVYYVQADASNKGKVSKKGNITLIK